MISRNVEKAYRAYRDALTEAGEELSGSLWVTLSKTGKITGKGLSIDSIKLLVKTAGEAVGLESLSPHDLRHSMATRAYLADIPVISIQRRLGHSSASTTERYIDTEKLKRYTDFDKEF